MTKRKDPEDILKAGRPKFPYDSEMALEICEAVATRTDPMATILASNEAWPCVQTIRYWRFTNPTFSSMFINAKRAQADLFAEELIAIADDSTNDYMIGKDGLIVNSENIARSKLRVETRKWLASKLQNKVYGDKTTTEAHIYTHEQSLKDLA